MGDLKSEVKSSFRTEMFAAGLYAVLYSQCRRKNPELGKKLKDASEQEHMHGKLFLQYYRNCFNNDPGSEKFWFNAGKFAGKAISFIPLKKKLKLLSGKESEAVSMIEEKLKHTDDPSFQKILKRILPDEISHSALYGDVF